MSGWQPIETAPFQTVLEVRNSLAPKPWLATRGYIHNGMVHENLDLFTTVYTPDPYFPTPPGQLCCPDEWRYPTKGGA